MAPQIFSQSLDFWKSKYSWENFRTFIVGKDKCLGFYRKIFEFAPTTLPVPRRLWMSCDMI